MKKAVVILGSALFLAGCTHKIAEFGQKTSSSDDQSQTSVQAEAEYSKVAAAIASGKAAECTMTNTKDGSILTYQIKGKKMRTTVAQTSDGQSGMMISDGNYMYSWSNESKQGVKFAIPTEESLKELTTQQGQTVPDFSQPDTQEKYQDLGFTVNCTARDIADSEFVPPTDITFTDASEMMKMMQQQGER